MINYQNFQFHRTDHVTAPDGGILWNILNIQSFNDDAPAVSQSAAATLSFNYNAATVEVGQHVDAGDELRLRFFGGLEYAHIRHNLNTEYDNVANIEDDVFFGQENVFQESKFSGVGPVLGVDMYFPLSQHFELRSRLAGGMLFGRLDSKLNDQIAAGFEGQPPVQVFDPTNLGVDLAAENNTVPTLGLKIGAAYTSAYRRLGWILEAGYQTDHYFNAATTFRHVNNLGGAIFVKQVGDISVAGPYVSLTLTGIAACPLPCNESPEPFPAIVPTLPGGPEFAIEVAYLTPHANNLDFAIADPFPAAIVPTTPPAPPPPPPPLTEIAPSADSRLQFLQPSSKPGYRLHLGYIFPLTANDVSLNYFWYDATDSARITKNFGDDPDDDIIWTSLSHPDADLHSFPVVANSANASVRFSNHAANLEVGRRVKFHRLFVRAAAGVAYDRLTENIETVYHDALSANSTPIAIDTINQQNTFRGFGPRLGIDGNLDIWRGFELVGHAATDLLVGRINSSFTEQNTNGFATTLNPERRNRLVPTFEARLGLAYAFPLFGCSRVTIEAGYQVNHYFDAVDSFRFVSPIGAENVKQDQDVSFDGFYGRLQVNLSWPKACCY
jgi:hypothetical protein